jgi:hypothetical protein
LGGTAPLGTSAACPTRIGGRPVRTADVIRFVAGILLARPARTTLQPRYTTDATAHALPIGARFVKLAARVSARDLPGRARTLTVAADLPPRAALGPAGDPARAAAAIRGGAPHPGSAAFAVRDGEAAAAPVLRAALAPSCCSGTPAAGVPEFAALLAALAARDGARPGPDNARLQAPRRALPGDRLTQFCRWLGQSA